MPETRPPDVDIVITFRATKPTSLSKHQTREDARKAAQQYKTLIETLTYAGLKAVGRRGESLGHLLVFVTCPPKLVEELVRRERLPVAPAANVIALSPAERIRLVYTYITSTPSDGGLGISPEAPEWDLVESIFTLHDREFNEVILGLIGHFLLPPYSPVYSVLVSVWSIVFVEWWRVHERILSLRFGTRGSFKVEKHRAQWKKGLSWWQRELRVLASVPIILLFAGILSTILTGIFIFEAFVTQLYQGPGKHLITFSPTLIFVVLVPRVLALYQAIAVRLTNWENHSHKSTHTASLTLKTFALSAVVAYLGLALSAFVYVPFGEGVMRWVQAWLFNGVPTTTHTGISAAIRDMLNGTISAAKDSSIVVDSVTGASPKLGHVAMWDIDPSNARLKLNPGRLREQMFAYTVTAQVVNTFTEVALPFLLRRISAFRKDRAALNKPKPIVAPSSGASATGSTTGTSSAVDGQTASSPTLKKRVVFEDEKERGGLAERAFLDKVREEAALPDYDLFVDYNEMVVQFGYVALWSAMWPLAGTMAFLNNLLELRSDAFKITINNRRPIPCRTDTIGPWLDTLTFLTWLGALTNSALVYLFSPQLLPSSSKSNFAGSTLLKNVSELLNESTAAIQEHFVSASGGRSETPSSPATSAWGVDGSSSPSALWATRELLLKAALVALIASHGFILVRLFIRHIVEKVFWRGSGEVAEREREDREVKVQFLKGAGPGGSSGLRLVGEVRIERNIDDPDGAISGESEAKGDEMAFWDHDEGIDEIQRLSKEA
ncbi:calcium-activated chloride channel-domain-containing protein [Gymnopilus junonius]|uniref:Calcium-activated chloride channel-domain-containing protein n=1 Tax=Gymnopilus junonius TaxID=109634 RepID=A0A9P5NGD8_GYMJU|nr:calcium-activated chloride channel-domain-containing protein [Gymnopilus junonius]